MTLRRTNRTVMKSLILFAVLTAAYVAYDYQCRQLREMYTNLSAAVSVHNALAEFMNDHKRWPKSADELKTVSTSANDTWPAAAADSLRRIHVRFNISLQDVAKASVDGFPYFVSNGPIVAGPFRRRIEYLIAQAQEIVKAEERAKD